MNGNGNESEYREPENLAVFVDGVFFSRHFETNRPMKEHMDCVRALQMREDDVILCSFPKSGCHWLWEMASMLLAGKAEYEKRSKMLAMLEATSIKDTQAMTSPRILNTHVPAFMLPNQIKEKKVKVILLYRNLKDVSVSLYFHFKQYPGREDLSIENMFSRSFFCTQNANGNYFAYHKSMDAFVKENPDVPVFKVSFEEMKKDPLCVVSQLGEFLDLSPSPQLCADIVQATTISKMREADKNKLQNHKIPCAEMYRKGEVGDWKNYLTVAQSERLDTAMKQLEDMDYSFVYEL